MNQISKRSWFTKKSRLSWRQCFRSSCSQLEEMKASLVTSCNMVISAWADFPHWVKLEWISAVTTIRLPVSQRNTEINVCCYFNFFLLKAALLNLVILVCAVFRGMRNSFRTFRHGSQNGRRNESFVKSLLLNFHLCFLASWNGPLRQTWAHFGSCHLSSAFLTVP